MGASRGVRMRAHRIGFSLLGSLLFLLGLACGSRADLFAPNSAPPDDDSYIRAHEQALFQKHPGLGSRGGNRLTINTAADTALTFDSMPAGCGGLSHAERPSVKPGQFPPCLIYRLYGYDSAQDVVTVLHIELEWNEVILIDRKSGAQIPLGSEPIVSPGGQYWAAVRWDDMNGEDWIEIVARIDHAIRLVVRFEDQRCAFEGWRSATSFAVICQDLVERSDGRYPCDERLVLRDSSGKWTVLVTKRNLPDDALERAANP